MYCSGRLLNANDLRMTRYILSGTLFLSTRRYKQEFRTSPLAFQILDSELTILLCNSQSTLNPFIKMSPSDPPTVPHTFEIPSLSYSNPPNTQIYVRISMFFMKKPSVSYEFFRNHWNHVHADRLISSNAFRELGILRYTQFFHDPEAKEVMKRIGYPSMEWDACTEFWVEKLEDFEAFTKTKEYIDTTRKFHVPQFETCRLILYIFS
jgi:hypothetical protein